MSLQLQGISKVFTGREQRGQVVAVDDVSLEIHEGEFLTLLGPSGCGKTTTLRLIAGFEIPSDGRIVLDGMDITNRPANRRDMAMVFQSYALFPHMSVYHNVAYGLQVQGEKRARIQERVKDVLSQVGLVGLEKRRPNQLSGGQQQRVALARALVMEPRVLLFDEPLSNLDAKLRVQMRSEIRTLQQRLNITSVYVTHDQVEAMALSDRIVVMNSGHIEQIATPMEIYRYPRSRFVADFIGRANFIPAQVQAVNGQQASATLLGQTVEVSASEGVQPGQTVMAVVRPEGVNLRSDPNLPQVQVDQVMYLGAEVEYMVRLADGQGLVVVDSDPRTQQIFQVGESAGIDFYPSTVHLLAESAG